MIEAAEEEAIWVKITETRGSTPRDAGTAMMVTASDIKGTIGGGALEHQAIAEAREMLVSGGPERLRRLALGPGLGQCCGGAVTLRFTRERQATDLGFLNVHRLRSHGAHPGFLWLWGAGHVGRAVVLACPPQAFKITWVDETAERFPDWARATQRPGLTILPAADMPRLAARAPTYAHHLIFTYSHQIDLALCAALLQRTAASIGLIGSETKRARFWARLSALGLDPEVITCPIGDRSLGKAPQDIARGTVAALVSLTRKRVGL